jgi:polyisoprenoid-binding protein YceI
MGDVTIGRRGLALGCLLALGMALGTRADEEAPHDAILFSARNLILTAHGEFHRWHVRRASIDEDHPERSVVEVEIDLASVDTGIERRDEHLRTAEFFDVERFPTALVTLEGFREGQGADADRFTADVTLDLHGVTRRFPMEFAIVDRKTRRIAGEVTLRRTDFGIGGPVRRWNPVSVRDEVHVHVDAGVPPAGSSEAPPSPR